MQKEKEIKSYNNLIKNIEKEFNENYNISKLENG